MRELPVGTQVVVRRDKSSTQLTNDGIEQLVGTILRGPVGRNQLYLVELLDRSTHEFPIEQLVVRRTELNDILAPQKFDPLPYVILSVQLGSKAYGLQQNSSDDDVRGIFLPDAEQDWSLFPVPEQFESKVGLNDEVYWELEKFIRLALKANPTVLEVLWSPIVLHVTDLGRELLSIRQHFISRHVYKTFAGYVISQFRHIRRDLEGSQSFKPKHAMHLIRLLLTGIELLKTGELKVDWSDRREDLLQIRNGLPFEQIEKWANQLLVEFQTAFEKTTLPEQPSIEEVNQYLLRARRARFLQPISLPEKRGD